MFTSSSDNSDWSQVSGDFSAISGKHVQHLSGFSESPGSWEAPVADRGYFPEHILKESSVPKAIQSGGRAEVFWNPVFGAAGTVCCDEAGLKKAGILGFSLKTHVVAAITTGAVIFLSV